MKLKYTLLFICLLFISSSIISQNFVGKVIDSDNTPIYGSTIFIKEKNQGLMCNEKGEYQSTLAPGKYTIEYRCLGYKPQTIKIDITTGETIEQNIILQVNTIELKGVVISNKEDPAYEIMRKAIAQAPKNAIAAKSFKAECYIKGVFEIEKVSKLVDKYSSIGDSKMKLSDLKEKLFLQESYNEIEFTAPDKYVQTVKAFSSSIPDDLTPDDALNIMNGSLYAERFEGLISPLSANALSYYNFRYEGFIEEGDKAINKIKVIAKYTNPLLMDGYLYIADDTWDIRSADITAKLWGMKNAFTITYSNVTEELYLPSAYTNRMSMDMFGLGAYFNYFASIKYNEVEVNRDIEKAITAKEKKKREFEIKADTTYTVKTDSLATKRDSLYWTDVRNTPLTGEEITSYERTDSIQSKIDSTRKDRNNSKFKVSSILFGGRVGGDSTKFEIKYGGIKGSFYDYNFVDGFLLGQKLEMSLKLKGHKKLSFTPEAYYALARKAPAYRLVTKLDYAPSKIGELKLSAGRFTEDFNPDGIDRFDNAGSSLLSGKNYTMFYEKTYLSLHNSIEIANGLKLETELATAKRSGLKNNTNYYFTIKGKTIYDYILFNTVPTRDITPNWYFSNDSHLTTYNIKLKYAPYAYYSMKDGKKTYKNITSPIFELSYTEAVSLWEDDDATYRKIQGGVKQYIKLGYFSSFSYNLQAGAFLGNRSQISPMDFQGFNTSDIWWGVKRPFQSFMLLNSYEASTSSHWMATHINYSSQYLLIKRLPFLQNTFINESLHLKGLHTPTKKYYSEIGYSLDFMGILNIGVYGSFEKFKHKERGIRLYLTFGSMGKHK